MQGVFDFTDDEIRAELRRQGYVDLPAPRLARLREDLKQLIAQEQKNSSATSDPSATSLSTSRAATSLQDESASLGHHVVQPPATDATAPGRSASQHSAARAGLPLRNARDAFASRPEAAGHADKENAGAGAAWSSAFAHKTYRQLLLPRDGHRSPPPPSQGAEHQPGQRATLGSVTSSDGRAAGHLALKPVQQQLRSAAAVGLHPPGRRAPLVEAAAAAGGGDVWRDHRQREKSTDRSYENIDDVDDESEDLPSFIKRKVLRKRAGRTEICDESIATSNSDADNVSALSERLFRMPALNEMARAVDNAPAVTKSLGVLAGHLSKRPDSPDTSSSLGPRRSAASVRTVGSGNACRSSVIIPSDPPRSGRAIGRCDPVRRHLEYERLWAAQRTTEDRQQKGLRWRVRERMLVRDVVYQKRQWLYQPNTYEVPTSKQRKALRWQVRADMAHGVLPLAGRKA